MSNRLCLSVVGASAAMVLVACQGHPSDATQPIAPSPVANVTNAQTPGNGSVSAAAKAGDDKQHAVTLFDACDPETFNAALGPGTCTRSGGVRFATFLEQLGKHHFVGAWHFAPNEVTMRVGDALVAINRGGETHTFTEVEEYGGGIVPQLNQLAGLTQVAPECSQLKPKDFIAPGASSSDDEEEAGVEKYQCCIHPWMRAEVRIAKK